MSNVVFIPGLLSDAALFSAQMNALAVAGHKPVAFTATGADTISAIAASIIARAPEKFILAGLSMGGYVCLEMMRQASQRVEKLILMNTSARTDPPEQLEKRAALIQLAHLGRFKGVTPRLLPLLINKKNIRNTAMTQVIFDMAERMGRDNFVQQQVAIMSRADSRPSLASISVPTLIIGGADDQIAPPELSHEMASLIPNAQLEILSDCGHLCTLEQPERVNRLLQDFIGVA